MKFHWEELNYLNLFLKRIYFIQLKNAGVLVIVPKFLEYLWIKWFARNWIKAKEEIHSWLFEWRKQCLFSLWGEVTLKVLAHNLQLSRTYPVGFSDRYNGYTWKIKYSFLYTDIFYYRLCFFIVFKCEDILHPL